MEHVWGLGAYAGFTGTVITGGPSANPPHTAPQIAALLQQHDSQNSGNPDSRGRVPITPELRSILQALFDQAPEGSENVVPRLFDPTTTLRKLIARAGLRAPAAALPQKTRASRATDWTEVLPAHVVAKWIGHSPLLAAKHYLQTRDAHFEVAIRGGSCSSGTAQPSE